MSAGWDPYYPALAENLKAENEGFVDDLDRDLPDCGKLGRQLKAHLSVHELVDEHGVALVLPLGQVGRRYVGDIVHLQKITKQKSIKQIRKAVYSQAVVRIYAHTSNCLQLVVPWQEAPRKLSSYIQFAGRNTSSKKIRQNPASQPAGYMFRPKLQRHLSSYGSADETRLQNPRWNPALAS